MKKVLLHKDVLDLINEINHYVDNKLGIRTGGINSCFWQDETHESGSRVEGGQSGFTATIELFENTEN